MSKVCAICGKAPAFGNNRSHSMVATKRLLARDRLTQGIEVEREGDGVGIDLHVVVEYGLNLAEVAATVRSRVAYEVERLTGLRVSRIEVHIEDVRRSA